MTLLVPRLRSRFPFLLASVLLTLLATRAGAQNPAWDHYKAYDVSPNPTVNLSVELRDQFTLEGAFVKTLFRVANPAEKRLRDGSSFPISDPRLHYTWWELEPRPITRTVNVANQFGTQTLLLSLSRYLLNPALKNESGSLPLANHYKCYDCTGNDVRVTGVTMIDQFGTHRADISVPLWFCTPTEKRVAGVVYPIVDPNRHYVCYIYSPPHSPLTFAADVTDQFMSRATRVTFSGSKVFCVPTEKVDPTPARLESWGRLKMLYR